MKGKRNIREAHLHQILLNKYLPSKEQPHSFDTSELKNTLFEKALLETYRTLGGLLEFPEITMTSPLMEFDRFSAILDNAIHFNRYRAKTLRSPFYKNLTSFPLIKYRIYCRKYEVECLKIGTSGTFWTSDEAEKHFGPSQRNGDLGLNGSAEWKMNAIKDFVIDILARHHKIRLLRISIWDDLMINKGLKKFNDLLLSPGKTASELMLKSIERRVIGLYADDL